METHPTPLPADAIPLNKAAELLHCHPSKLIRWILNGVIPGWRVKGPHKRRWFVSRSDLEARVERVQPTRGQTPPESKMEQQALARWEQEILHRHGLDRPSKKKV